MTAEILNTSLKIETYRKMLELCKERERLASTSAEIHHCKQQSEATKKELHKLYSQQIKEIPVHAITKLVCNYFNIDLATFQDRNVKPNIPLKIAIYLFYHHGFKYREIAKILGITKEAVSYHRKWMSENWNKEYDFIIEQLQAELFNPKQ